MTKQNKKKNIKEKKRKKKAVSKGYYLTKKKKKEFRWILLIPVSYLGLTSHADVLRVSSKFVRHDQAMITREISFWH